MTEILDTVLSNDNIFIIGLAFVVFVITDIIKKILPSSTRLKTGLIPFLLGILLYSIFAVFLFKEKNVFEILEHGISVGGVATLIYAVGTQIVKDGGIKKTLTQILKGILTNSSLKSIVSDIIDGYSEENTHEENYEVILMLLTSNTSMSEEECKTITEIIMKAFTDKDKGDLKL